MTIVEKLFKSKYRILKIVGVIIFIGATLVSLYASLTVAALMGVEDSNKWAISYLVSFFSEFAFISPIVCFVKIKLFNYALVNKFCLCGIIKKILGK